MQLPPCSLVLTGGIGGLAGRDWASVPYNVSTVSIAEPNNIFITVPAMGSAVLPSLEVQASPVSRLPFSEFNTIDSFYCFEETHPIPTTKTILQSDHSQDGLPDCC